MRLVYICIKYLEKNTLQNKQTTNQMENQKQNFSGATDCTMIKFHTYAKMTNPKFRNYSNEDYLSWKTISKH